MVVELVRRDDILQLRASVLRANLPIEASYYAGDAVDGVFHLAARDGSGAIVGCATLFPEPLPDAAPPDLALPDRGTIGSAWRLRGMATAARLRNQGLGGLVLETGAAEVARRGGTVLWCNGRAAARAFYQRHGFVVRGEPFEVAPLGWHYQLVRTLTAG